MRIFLLILTLSLAPVAFAEMHIIVPAQVLTAPDTKGDRRELAIKMPVIEYTRDAQTKEILTTTVKPTEYHRMVPDDFDFAAAGATYAATWDGKAPCVTVLVGTPGVIHMAYMGWPMIDCKDFVAPEARIQ